MMRLALMHGDLVPAPQLRSLGFEAVQIFFGSGPDGARHDPAPAEVDSVLRAGGTALAAMTLHVDLVGPRGPKADDVARLVACVQKTAALEGRFGANERPVLIWHPSGYPPAEEVDDRLLFAGLATALGEACRAAEKANVWIAVEITRGGTVGSAEAFLRLQDRVGSEALKVCLDAANFVPDRTPLDRAVRVLGPDTVIAHAKDSSFGPNGQVAAYGPVGSGELDYPEYVRLLNQYGRAAYLVLEYYRSREDLLRARDIVIDAGLRTDL
jgi:sugar phosphate isomerase/epimerase